MLLLNVMNRNINQLKAKCFAPHVTFAALNLQNISL